MVLRVAASHAPKHEPGAEVAVLSESESRSSTQTCANRRYDVSGIDDDGGVQTSVMLRSLIKVAKGAIGFDGGPYVVAVAMAEAARVEIPTAFSANTLKEYWVFGAKFVAVYVSTVPADDRYTMDASDAVLVVHSRGLVHSDSDCVRPSEQLPTLM